MEKIITFLPAYDKRNPKPAKDYGIHGVELRMILKGELGAVSFLLMTNWHLPHIVQEQEQKHKDFIPGVLLRPLPADISYHSYKPLHDFQTEPNPCTYLDGGLCYSDGSTLSAQFYFDVLVEKGSAVFWNEMENYYTETFGELK